MGSDEIAKMYAKLSLLEREGPVQRLQEVLKMASAQRLALSLVGKVISNKMINRDVFMGAMGRVWQVSDCVEIEFVSSNIFMFHFNNLGDRTRVLNGGPWTFDGALITLGEPTRKGDIGALTFCYSERVLTGTSGSVDITNTLRRFLRVDVMGDGEETVMMLCYERRAVLWRLVKGDDTRGEVESQE
ncbi:hypothetical protein EZV62_015488 [Acer yangbiense]|uniref:DUF4283 domain-containing protein n=1 Tax=Acer yangbiense TaxID=1000413 RepID=A0A5C7HLK5_9ROSI|nr:hypothetical protein EZV62_015488 [Acer yangbiense]